MAAAARELGLEPPESVADPPRVDDRFSAYWVAYTDLMTEVRNHAGAIPWSSIDRWCERHGLDVDEVKRIVWHLDDVARSASEESSD